MKRELTKEEIKFFEDLKKEKKSLEELLKRKISLIDVIIYSPMIRFGMIKFFKDKVKK